MKSLQILFNRIRRLDAITCFFISALVIYSMQSLAQENENFSFERITKNSIEIKEKVSGKSLVVRPTFSLIESQKDPGLHYGRYRKDLGPINSVAWGEKGGEATIDVFESGEISAFKLQDFQKTRGR